MHLKSGSYSYFLCLVCAFVCAFVCAVVFAVASLSFPLPLHSNCDVVRRRCQLTAIHDARGRATASRTRLGTSSRIARRCQQVGPPSPLPLRTCTAMCGTDAAFRGGAQGCTSRPTLTPPTSSSAARYALLPPRGDAQYSPHTLLPGWHGLHQRRSPRFQVAAAFPCHSAHVIRPPALTHRVRWQPGVGRDGAQWPEHGARSARRSASEPCVP